MLKVLYLLNIPSPYRITYLNQLSKICDLTVIFERNVASDRDGKWLSGLNIEFNAVFLEGKHWKADSSVSFDVKHYIDKSFDCVVFCNFTSPTGIIGIRYCQRQKINYFVEADGAFYRFHPFKNCIKRRLLSKAIGCFSTCLNSDNYFRKLGVKDQKIYRYRFSSLTEADFDNNSKIVEDKNFLKQKMAIPAKKIILFVGQMIHRKGVDLLLNACRGLTDKYCLVLVGGSLKNKYLKQLKSLKCDYIVAGFKTKDELKQYYQVADVFVLPTREDIWGLVINEALSFGLPIVSTNNCNAGIELIKSNTNGFIVNASNSKELLESMIKASNFNNVKRLDCIKSVKQYTIENMVIDHMSIFENYEKENCIN